MNLTEFASVTAVRLCAVGKLTECAEAEDGLAKGYTRATVIRWLRSCGHYVSEPTFRKHANGECCCGR